VSNRILIIGVHTYNSGKTRIAGQIVDYLHNKNLKAEYFKPLSAHNFWHNYAHSERCLESGSLYSKDAAYVRQFYESNLPVELSNPVHRLYAPALTERPLGPLPSTLAIAGMDSVLVMQRFSHPKNEGIESTILLAQELIDAQSVLFTKKDAQKIMGDAMVENISSFSEAHAFEEAMLEGHIGDSFDWVKRKSDFVVIEAFNDTVWPWEELTSVDSVIAVSPGQVFSYEPERMLKAVRLSTYSNASIREVSFRQVADLVKPIRQMRTYPNSGLAHEDIERLIQI
jgi:predicted P-loop ATPase/GTPase